MDDETNRNTSELNITIISHRLRLVPTLPISHSAFEPSPSPPQSNSIRTLSPPQSNKIRSLSSRFNSIPPFPIRLSTIHPSQYTDPTIERKRFRARRGGR